MPTQSEDIAVQQNKDDKAFKITADRVKLLDDKIYTADRVKMYDRIFGRNFASTGGKETTNKFLKELNLKPGDCVLDIGCGIGGSAFLMDLEYGAKVRGIDLCSNMLEIARERQKELGSKNTTFVLEDVMTVDYEENQFDLIYSRDVFIHLAEKEFLYGKIMKWLKPGGRMFITDYTLIGNQTPRFAEIIKDYHYRFVGPEDHEEYMRKCGYVDIKVRDHNDLFLSTLRRELRYLLDNRDEFIKEFGQQGYAYSLQFWSERLYRAESGLQGWVSVTGKKPAV